MEDDTSDQAMLAAIRKRLMDEIARERGGEKIVNNVYGASPYGLVERLSQENAADPGTGEDGADPYEYMVDIDREDKLDEAGNKVGWTKKVRRYRTGMPGEKKK